MREQVRKLAEHRSIVVPRRARMLTGMLVALLLASMPPRLALAARPDKAAAQRTQELNDAARLAFKDGRFDEAADLFMQLYDQTRTTTAVFNAARAREMARKLPEARALFELYLRIEKSLAGQEDARRRIADIETTLRTEAEAKARAEAEARAKADDDARQAAEIAARKVEAERLELGRLQAEKARLEVQRAVLAGVTFLPPVGATAEESVRALQEVLQAAMAEARAAQVGPVHPVADYVQAEMQRKAPGECDFHCQMAVARSLGSAYAVTTALRQEGGQMRLRLVLWRTVEAADTGQVEVVAWTLPGLTQRARLAAGGLWGSVRRFVLQPQPVPAAGQPVPTQPLLLVESEPIGAVVALDEIDVGSTPVQVPIPPGPHRLRLQKTGYHPRAGALTMPAAGQRLTVLLPAELPSEAAPETPADPTQARPAMVLAPTAVPPALGPTKTGKSPPPQLKSTPATQKRPEVASRAAEPAQPQASGLRWGLVASTELGLALIQDPKTELKPDFSSGVGGFGHLGWGPEDGAWVALAMGARWHGYGGLSAPSGTQSTPHGTSYWSGILLPPVNLLLSYHRNWMTPDNGFGEFSYDTLQGRVVQAKGWLFFAFGVEALLSSARAKRDMDEFGSGPNLRVTVELGINVPGTPMSH